MIGTSLALALAPLGLRVAVVEAVDRRAPAQPSFDDRSTALSRSSQRLFEALGLWPEIVAAATSIRSIHVSDRGRFAFTHIDAEEQNVEALGYVVINRVLGEVLQRALDASATRFTCPARVCDVRRSTGALEVDVDTNGELATFRCSLLVAADGATSRVRDLLGIGASRSDYSQHAIIGNVLPEKKPDHHAF